MIDPNIIRPGFITKPISAMLQNIAEGTLENEKAIQLLGSASGERFPVSITGYDTPTGSYSWTEQAYDANGARYAKVSGRTGGPTYAPAYGIGSAAAATAFPFPTTLERVTTSPTLGPVYEFTTSPTSSVQLLVVTELGGRTHFSTSDMYANPVQFDGRGGTYADTTKTVLVTSPNTYRTFPIGTTIIGKYVGGTHNYQNAWDLDLYHIVAQTYFPVGYSLRIVNADPAYVQSAAISTISPIYSNQLGYFSFTAASNMTPGTRMFQIAMSGWTPNFPRLIIRPRYANPSVSHNIAIAASYSGSGGLGSAGDPVFNIACGGNFTSGVSYGFDYFLLS